MTHVSPAGHTEHAAPPVPHAPVTLPGWQVPVASQQPVGHVDALHAGAWHLPALHVSPEGHAMHEPPPVPQAPGTVPVSQNPRASQQPVGQVVGPHATPMHTPPTHESPGGQGTHANPPVPHADVLVPVWHLPELSQQPIGQLSGLHVTPSHAPAMQKSPVGHAAQA